jgi:predicted RNA-binding protein with PIN domain
MAYLIDGHNLIGQMSDISLSDPDDEMKLVIKLRGLAARENKRVIVIFDNGVPSGKSQASNGSVDVVFASPGSSADSIMLERIKNARDPHHWVVVSGDNVVLAAARGRKMKTYKSADFVRVLHPPKRNKHDKDAALDQPDAKVKGRFTSSVEVDIRMTPQEVEAWLKFFSERSERGDG